MCLTRNQNKFFESLETNKNGSLIKQIRGKPNKTNKYKDTAKAVPR